MEHLVGYDLGWLNYFEGYHHPSLSPLMVFLHQWGGFRGMTALVVIGFVLFRLAGRRDEAWALLAAGLLALLLDTGGKYLVGRARPDVAWRLVDLPKVPSFPSGHALAGLGVCGTIVIFASRGLRPRLVRYTVIVAGLSLGLLVGVSRVYVGVHYPLDVLAGWAGGVLCILLAVSLAPGSPQGPGQQEPDRLVGEDA